MTWFWLKGQRSTLGLGLTAILCGFELYECLSVVCLFVTEPVVKFLLTNVQQPKLSAVSSAAIKRICITCPNAMSGHLPSLLQLVQSVNQIALSNAATNWLIEGRHHRTSAVLNYFATIAIVSCCCCCYW